MQDSEVQTVIRYIDELIARTKAGSMGWSAANPTTYVWSAPPPKRARLVLQRTTSPSASPGGKGFYMKAFHQLQAIDDVSAKVSEVKFTANGAELDSINERLANLFSEIQSAITRSGINFLQSLLPE